MAAGWTPVDIELMEQEHRDLLRAIAAKPALRAAVVACKDGGSFGDGWSVVKARYDSLQRFVGGIVSVFLGTSQVGSDFLILKAEGDDFQTSLTDLSQRDVLHSKQFSKIVFL